MSRFKRAVAFLARVTGAPLFVRMREERRALPMAEGIAKQLTPMVPHGKRAQVRSMVFMLNHSRRYLEACIVDGAMRFNADGSPAGPVSERERRIAVQRRAVQAAEAESKARAGDQSTREAVPTVGGVHADSQSSFPGPIPAKAGCTPGDVSRTLSLAGAAQCVAAPADFRETRIPIEAPDDTPVLPPVVGPQPLAGGGASICRHKFSEDRIDGAAVAGRRLPRVDGDFASPHANQPRMEPIQDVGPLVQGRGYVCA